MYLREILEKVKSGELSVDEAERRVGLETYADMGYAKLDTAREQAFQRLFIVPENQMNILYLYMRNSLRRTEEPLVLVRPRSSLN